MSIFLLLVLVLGATAYEPEDKLSYALEALLAGSDQSCKQYKGDCEACTKNRCTFVPRNLVFGRRELSSSIKWPGACLELKTLLQGRRLLTSTHMHIFRKPITDPIMCPTPPLPPNGLPKSVGKLPPPPSGLCEELSSNCFKCVSKGCAYSYPLQEDGTSKGVCADTPLVGARRELMPGPDVDYSVCKPQLKPLPIPIGPGPVILPTPCEVYSNCYECLAMGCAYLYPLLPDGTSKGVCAPMLGGRRELTAIKNAIKAVFSVCKRPTPIGKLPLPPPGTCEKYSSKCFKCVSMGCAYSYPIQEDGTLKGVCAEIPYVGGRRELMPGRDVDYSVCKPQLKPLPIPIPFGPGPVILPKQCEDYSNCYVCVLRGCVYSYALQEDGTSKGVCADTPFVGARRELTAIKPDFRVCKMGFVGP